MTTDKSIGQTIKRLIEEKGYKKTEVALLAGMSLSLLSQKMGGESKRFTIQEVRLMSEILEIKESTIYRRAEKNEKA